LVAFAEGYPEEAVRALWLHAHSQELAPVLRGVVVTPTDTQRAAYLPHRLPLLAIDMVLSPWAEIPAVLQELSVCGLPDMHKELLQSYMQPEFPTYQVAVACVAVLLAHALTTS
jgi:hypothetical protein